MNTFQKVSLGTIGLLAVCSLGLILGYRLGCDPILHEAAKQGDAMAWIKHEYHLTPAQFDAIVKLHGQYTDACDEHCHNIQMAVRGRNKLLQASPKDEAAIAAANEQIKELSARCETALKEHLVKVASLMSTQDGSRYLETMLPLLERFDHSGAPDLRMASPSHVHEH